MAKQASGKNTVRAVEAIVTPVLEQMGLRLWDVRYEKEGPDWFLRIFIDRADGQPLDINTCEDATRAVNPVLDEADPVSGSYYMELGSPGLGRRLVRDEHFAAMTGRKITAHLIRPNEAGEREVTGTLLGKKEGVVSIETEAGTVQVDTTAADRFKLDDDDDLF